MSRLSMLLCDAADSEVYSYSLAGQTWTPHSFMLSKRKRHQAVLLAGKMFALGGTNQCSRTLDTVEVSLAQQASGSE